MSGRWRVPKRETRVFALVTGFDASSHKPTITSRSSYLGIEVGRQTEKIVGGGEKREYHRSRDPVGFGTVHAQSMIRRSLTTRNGESIEHAP